MSKEAFIAAFKMARTTLNETIADLSEAQAGATPDKAVRWPSIKDMVSNLAAWEREVLIADEMIKRGEESYLADLDQTTFEQTQAEHRRNWTFEQVTTELDLNYEALLMAWDEYEGEDGPFGSSTWQRDQPHSLWWLIDRQRDYTDEIARRRSSFSTT